MQQSKINFLSAFNQPEIGKTSPAWIKIDEHFRHTAIVIVSAMKLLGGQSRTGKLFIKLKKKEFPSQKGEVGFLKYVREIVCSFYNFA